MKDFTVQLNENNRNVMLKFLTDSNQSFRCVCLWLDKNKQTSIVKVKRCDLGNSECLQNKQ